MHSLFTKSVIISVGETKKRRYLSSLEPTACWRNGYGVATPKVAGSIPSLVLAGNNLGQVVHTGGLSSSIIIWYRLRGGDALRLRRSGVALAIP